MLLRAYQEFLHNLEYNVGVLELKYHRKHDTILEFYAGTYDTPYVN